MSNPETTSTSPSKMGSGLGQKIRGAAEVVHGVGDTLRGTMLGTVDSIGGQLGLRSKEDEIAQQGKLEIERGLGNWKGASTPSAISPSHSAYGQQAHVQTTAGVAPASAAAPYGGGVPTTGDPKLGYASGDEHAHATTGAYGPASSYPSAQPRDSGIAGSPPEPQGLTAQQPRCTRKFGSGYEHDSSASGGLTEGRALDQQQYPPPTHYGSPPQSQGPTGVGYPKT